MPAVIKEKHSPYVSGFSLIELMVVISVFSIAASVFVPRYLRHEMQVRQQKCHAGLKSLHEAEKSYYKKHASFTEQISLLGWADQGHGYTCHFVPSPSLQKTFLFECQGNIDRDPTIDRAMINETGTIQQLSDDIEN